MAVVAAGCQCPVAYIGVHAVEHVPLALNGLNHLRVELVVSCLELVDNGGYHFARAVFAGFLVLVDCSSCFCCIGLQRVVGEFADKVAAAEVLHVEVSHCYGRVGNAYVVEVLNGSF